MQSVLDRSLPIPYRTTQFSISSRSPFHPLPYLLLRRSLRGSVLALRCRRGAGVLHLAEWALLHLQEGWFRNLPICSFTKFVKHLGSFHSHFVLACEEKCARTIKVNFTFHQTRKALAIIAYSICSAFILQNNKMTLSFTIFIKYLKPLPNQSVRASVRIEQQTHKKNFSFV